MNRRYQFVCRIPTPAWTCCDCCTTPATRLVYSSRDAGVRAICDTCADLDAVPQQAPPPAHAADEATG
jgi:hypothetical protein